MMRIKVSVELEAGEYSQIFEFDREDISHIPSGYSGGVVKETLHFLAVDIGQDVEKIWGIGGN